MGRLAILNNNKCWVKPTNYSMSGPFYQYHKQQYQYRNFSSVSKEEKEEVRIFEDKPKGWEIKEEYGVVFGHSVTSSTVVKNVLAGFWSFFGGSIKTFEQRVNHAKDNALAHIKLEAEKHGANALLDLKLQFNNTSDPLVWSSRYTYCSAYATAVLISPSPSPSSSTPPSPKQIFSSLL